MTVKQLPVVYLTDELARQTASLLDSFAQRRPSEGVVYWFGFEQPGVAVITTLVVPNADTSGGAVRTSAHANARAIELMVGTPLMYIGQAHSHPGGHVCHSPTDDADTFARCDGVISVVVPWFGRYGFHLDQCGVHRHINGRFRRVEHLDEHLRVIPGFADLRDGASR
jgi:hypothetical protein